MDTSYGKTLAVHDQGGVTHKCVGAIIERANRFLLIKRRCYPFGYGLPAGHLEYGEQPLEGLTREVAEETALSVSDNILIYEGEIPKSKCRYGSDRHYWYFYECNVNEHLTFLNAESTCVGWYSLEEMNNLDLTPSARFIFEKIDNRL